MWTCVALSAFYIKGEPNGLAVFRIMFALACVATAGTIMSVVYHQLLAVAERRELEGAIKRQGKEVNCHTLAEQYVREYQNARMRPFTREEEGQLINYLVERFGVFEETAAEIVAANWPLHRAALKYRGVGDNAVTRGRKKSKESQSL